MSADKYPSIFSRQMEAIVYIVPAHERQLSPTAFLDNMKTILLCIRVQGTAIEYKVSQAKCTTQLLY